MFYSGLLALAICVAAILPGCGGAARKTPGNEQPGIAQVKKEAADDTLAIGPYWQIEVTDTKNFSYAVPVGNNGTIDMTATLYFIAWKQGGEDMFGQYEGRALVAVDMDFSKLGTGRESYVGGIMGDSISDNITFEIQPFEQSAVKVENENVDLAPLVNFTGQSEILTDAYSISQAAYKEMYDGKVMWEDNRSLGDGEKFPYGFTLKATKDTVLISDRTLNAAYGVGPFTGTIASADTQKDARSWFRDKVTARMEERLSLSEQSASQQMPPSDYQNSTGFESQNGFTVDSQGREGMDTNGDGKLEMYFDEDGEVWTDFDGDGKYENIESSYSD